MKAKRMRVTILLLAALLLTVFVTWLWPSREPAYRGKTVSVWFEEYARAGNPGFVRVTQRPGVIAIQASGYPRTPGDPAAAREALRRFGSNGVPYIAAYLRSGTAESQTYLRVFTNLPASIQAKVPSPFERRQRRRAAAEVIAYLGEPAKPAIPILLRELGRCDVSFHEDLLKALWSVGVEPRLITQVMVELGQQGKYAELVSIATRAGGSVDEAVVRLLGDALTTVDPEVRNRALLLLEKSGARATPAVARIVSSAAHKDPETRYLAIRVLRAIGTNTPAVMAALHSRLNDDDHLVRGATKRSLQQIESTTNVLYP